MAKKGIVFVHVVPLFTRVSLRQCTGRCAYMLISRIEMIKCNIAVLYISFYMSLFLVGNEHDGCSPCPQANQPAVPEDDGPTSGSVLL